MVITKENIELLVDILNKTIEIPYGFVVEEKPIAHQVLGVDVGVHFKLKQTGLNYLFLLHAIDKQSKVLTIELGEMERLFGELRLLNSDFINRNGIQRENVILDTEIMGNFAVLHYYQRQYNQTPELILTVFPGSEFTNSDIARIGNYFGSFLNQFNPGNERASSVYLSCYPHKPKSDKGIRICNGHELYIKTCQTDDSEHLYIDYVYVNPIVDRKEILSHLKYLGDRNECFNTEIVYSLNGIYKFNYSSYIGNLDSYYEDDLDEAYATKFTETITAIYLDYLALSECLGRCAKDCETIWDSNTVNLFNVPMISTPLTKEV